MLWNGPTWACDECGFENAVIRKRCRGCGEEPAHPDPKVMTGVSADIREAHAADRKAGLR